MRRPLSIQTIDLTEEGRVKDLRREDPAIELYLPLHWAVADIGIGRIHLLRWLSLSHHVMSLHRAILNHHTNMKRGNMQLLPHILKDILINADLMIDNRYASPQGDSPPPVKHRRSPPPPDRYRECSPPMDRYRAGFPQKYRTGFFQTWTYVQENNH